jgi:hypothetical protein
MSINFLRSVGLHVVVASNTMENSNPICLCRGCCPRNNAGLLHCFVGGHQGQSLCRIDLRGFFGGDAEETGVEKAHVRNPTAPRHFSRVSLSSHVDMCVDIPALRRNNLGRVDTLTQNIPKLLWVFCIGKSPRESDDCEFRQFRLPRRINSSLLLFYILIVNFDRRKYFLPAV